MEAPHTMIWPFRSKYPLKRLSLDELDQVALYAYADVAGVEVVEDHEGDRNAHHGMNKPGEF